MNPDQVKYSTSASEATPAEAEQVIFRAELNEYNPDSNKFVRINLLIVPTIPPQRPLVNLLLRPSYVILLNPYLF